MSRHRFRTFRTVLVALVVFLGGGMMLAPASGQPADLDAFITAALADYGVPGAAVAVVKDGTPVLVRGYGVRQLGEAAPVDANTVFQLASVTKTFTAAALGTLVDDNRVRWDDPVIDILPGFALHDPYPTRYATPRDLLAHRSGLPAFTGDLLGQLGYDRAEVLRRIRFVEPTHSFRERAAYSNLGFFVAGGVGAQGAGTSWEQLVATRLLGPLGMCRSGTSSRDKPADGNWAATHGVVAGQLQVVPWDDVDVLGPAGAMVSTAADMVPYMQMLLAGGTLGGTRILERSTVESLFEPSMVAEVSFTEAPPISSQTGFSYSLGWGVYYYQNTRVIEKGGALGGVRTNVTLVPEQQLGVTVLANRNLTALPEAIRARVLEHYLGNPGGDFQREIRARQAQIDASFQPEAPPAHPGPMSLPLAAFTGTYTNQVYGEFVVQVEEFDGDQLRVRAGPGGYPGKVTHWSRDTFALDWGTVTTVPELITFTVGPDGEPVAFTGDTLGRFTRQPEQR